MALVVREESDGSLRRFCHIGTGNYHPKTARLYEDFGLLTADRTVGEDITDLFNHLTGFSRHSDYRRLLVAPAGVRSRPDRAHRRAGGPGQGRPARADPDEVQRAHRRGHHRRAVPSVDARACPSTCGFAGSARSGPACRACRRRSGSAVSSAASLSTRVSTGSAPAPTARRRGLDRQRRHDAPQPGPPGRVARPRH